MCSVMVLAVSWAPCLEWVCEPAPSVVMMMPLPLCVQWLCASWLCWGVGLLGAWVVAWWVMSQV